MAARCASNSAATWLIVGALGLLTAAGCGGMHGARRGDVGRFEGTIPYSAARPPFGEAPGRAYFLGGYAGYNYAPVGRRSALPTRRGGDSWGYPVVEGALDLGSPQP